MKKIFLDIETTGLDLNGNDDIIEICCIEMLNRKLTKNIFHTYLYSNKIISKKVYLIHNINNKFLKDKPLFSDVVKNFINFISNSEIIVHNSKFDINFINLELKKNGLNEINNYCKKITDTLIISRKIFPAKRNSLNILCKRFNISIKNRKFHSAYIDIILLYKIYINIVKNTKKLVFKKKKNNKKYKFNYNNIVINSNKIDLYKHNYILKKINNCNF